MVEYALILIPFTLMTLGIIDLGRSIFYYNMLGSAAREGARVGISSSRTADEICAAAIRAAPLLPNVAAGSTCGTFGDLTVAVPQRGTAGDPSTPVKVTLTYNFRLVTPLISMLTGDPIVLRASSTMYVEVAGAAPTAGPSPTPKATLTPVAECIVPQLVGTVTNGTPSTQQVWAGASFTTTVNRGSGGQYQVASQSLPVGASVPCSAVITVYA